MNNSDQANYKKGIPSFLEHGSFAKLREVAVSYTLNKSVANTVFRGLARDVRLELNGRNLATFTTLSRAGPRGLKLWQLAVESVVGPRALSAQPAVLLLG